MGHKSSKESYPEAQIECQHVPVFMENKVQLIDMICHYLREQAHQLKE